MLLSACGGGNLASDQAATPRLASLDNFRDVGGAAGGYPTVEGRQVRRGMLYRSGALTEDAADKVTLDKLAFAAVYDLRTPGEIARAPDAVPAASGRTLMAPAAEFDITKAFANITIIWVPNSHDGD